MVYPTVDEKGNRVFESLTFGIRVLRKAPELPSYKVYQPEPSREELIQFLDEIHIKWEEDKGVPIKSLTTIKKHQLNAVATSFPTS